MTIISHRHRFIFIKTAKTAGTSIEIALSKFCGPEDVITRISSEDEKIRGELGYPGPRNFGVAPLSSYRFSDWSRLLRKGSRRPAFYNHMPAAAIRRLVGDDFWSGCFKFCFERNPWDRMLSMYHWENPSEPRPSLDEYLSRGIKVLRERGINLYTIDGRVAVDHVSRFENLSDELGRVREKLRLPEPLELPRAKGGYRIDRRHYRDVLNDCQRRRIADAFADEIELMGYEF